MRLAARLTILFLSLSIFPLAVMGSLAYNSGRQAIVHNSMNHLISTNVLKADEYNRWIEGEARLLGSLAQRPLVREDAAVLASTDPADPVYQAAREDIIQNHLAPSVEEKSGFLSLSVLRASDGLVFVSTDRRLEGQYRGSEPFFVEGERGTYVDSVRYFESEQGTAKHISTPIQDRQGNLVAVLVGRADLAVVSEIMWQRSGLSASEDTYLVDASSFFVTEPRFGGDYALKQAVHTEGVEACLAHRNGVGFYENYQGVPVIGAYRWIPARELCILTEVAQAEALVPIVALRATTLKIAAGAILAVVVLGLFYARTITRPVGQLVRGVGEIGRGNLDYRLAVRSQDEVGQLAGAFNAMAADLERLSRETHAWTAELEQRVEERTVALQEAEVRYRSLVEQIPAIIYTDSAEQVGQTLYISPQLKTTMGYAPEEWIADNELWLKIMPADDRERVSAEYVRANESGEPFRAEYRVVTPDGRTVWIRDEALLKRGLSGQPSFWQGIMLDISERKLNEAALQKAKEELERRNARLQALYRVGQAVNSTLETGAILDHLVGEAMRLTRATHGQVLVVREDLGLFEHRSLRGFSPEEAKLARLVPLPLDRGASGQAYTTRQAVCVDDVQAVPGYFPLIPTTRAEIAVPLVRGGQVLGNLDLQSPEVGAFHNLDLDYLEALADQASIALEKVRLYDEVRRRNEELALLNRVITASATSHDGEAILQTVCRELALAFGVPHSTATLLNPEKTEAVVVAEYLVESRPSALGKIISVAGYPPLQHLLQHKTPLLIHDAQTDPRLAPVHDVMRSHGTVSLLILPFLIEGEVIGSLQLDAIEHRPFSGEEVDLARRGAEQVAGALARTRLEETQRRLSTAAEQAAEGIIITDTQGAILYVNPAFERTTGYSRGEVIGQNPRLLKSGKHGAEFYRALWRTITAGRVWHGRFVNRKKGGGLLTADAVITPVHNQAGEIVSYVATMRDVTREVELEMQFRQAQKMEAVGRLAGGVAHDFNNLLTVIHLSTRLLERKLHPDDALWQHVQRIRETGERATGLVKQLLAFSRQEVIEPHALDLNGVVGDMGKILKRIIGEDIELTTHLAGGLWPVYADPTQIEQVILNLAVNARDAMPQGGALAIQTANVVLDEAYARQHLDVEPGEYVMLSVSDTGTGMDDEVKQHLFEPFFTTKERGKGTGLGLPIVFGAIKQNKGHIWVYSEVGHGTTFKIYLPHTEKTGVLLRSTALEAVSERAQVPRPTPTACATETLLVVEDAEDVRELAAQILGAQGYRVLSAANGLEALQIGAEHDGPIHLLLTDLVMPHMSGKELAEQLASGRPEMRALYMSGYTEDMALQRRVTVGDVAFISKPFTEEQLIQKVRSVLGGLSMDPQAVDP